MNLLWLFLPIKIRIRSLNRYSHGKQVSTGDATCQDPCVDMSHLFRDRIAPAVLPTSKQLVAGAQQAQCSFTDSSWNSGSVQVWWWTSSSMSFISTATQLFNSRLSLQLCLGTLSCCVVWSIASQPMQNWGMRMKPVASFLKAEVCFWLNCYNDCHGPNLGICRVQIDLLGQHLTICFLPQSHMTLLHSLSVSVASVKTQDEIL